MNKQSDYFAELYVAGKLADAGWNVYFPHREVKGKYPTDAKTNKVVYGFVGRLSQVHPQMILAIPYFKLTGDMLAPVHIAYMPYSCIKKHKRGIRCQPAQFKNSTPIPRREFKRFFDDDGIKLLESEEWAADYELLSRHSQS